MPFSRLVTAFKALRQLGFTQVVLNGVYKFGLKSGHYRRVTALAPEFRGPLEQQDLLTLDLITMPAPEALRESLGADGLGNLLAEADEVVSGKFRQFGGEPVDIQLVPNGRLAHWTEYETGQASHGADDIKLTWEPARFGWAFILGRAYHASGNERYAETFWQQFEIFERANPAYIGPNWTSGQEVGLRLMAFTWAGQIFAGSEHTTPKRQSALVEAIAVHACRIPPTFLYARSQNNNHVLTEAAALLTAGLALPEHPDSKHWQSTGRRWLEACFRDQIDANGEYVQHSANYQRLALQTALWVESLHGGPFLSTLARQQLGRAAEWLAVRLDPVSGQVPNLGANDGGLIFPFASAEINDYRPVTAACTRAFLGQQLPPGPWDEMSLWFDLPLTGLPPYNKPVAPGFLQAGKSWGSLRAVHYTSRPSHADQLHCELWWHGLNIARDPGTYLYNAAPPWDNQLTSTLVHNTLAVNGQEQMARAGRFLYLDWADASFETLPGDESNQRVIAYTQAYARFGARHTRSLAFHEMNLWSVQDKIVRSAGKALNTYRLHWLLPDWEWELDSRESLSMLRILSPYGWVILEISANQPFHRVGLVRAGELISGDGLLSPVFGWFSPTYNVKEPALSLAIEVQSARSVNFQSIFSFPK